MNAEIEKTFVFVAVLADQEKSAWINNYEVAVSMRVSTDSSKEYNIAYGRMRFWFDEVMRDAVLISQDHDRLRAWHDTGHRYLDFPTAVVDQVVGLMLMSKLTAMTEGRLEIQQISVCSAADDYIRYICDQGDHLHWFEQPGWWNDPGPIYNSGSQQRKSGKVIAMQRSHDWSTHDLAWNSEKTQKGSVTVLPGTQKDA